MSDGHQSRQLEALRTLKDIAEMLAGAKLGSTAALYGLPAGDDTLRQAQKTCKELYNATGDNAPVEQRRELMSQLQADVRSCAALGAIGGQELQDVNNLIDNLWNQMEREK